VSRPRRAQASISARLETLRAEPLTAGMLEQFARGMAPAVMNLACADKTARSSARTLAWTPGDGPMTIRTASVRWTMFALSTVIAVVALRYFLLPLTQAAGPEFGRHLAGHGYALFAHAGAGAIALLTGAVQWVTTSRTRRPRWHRLPGRLYVVAIGVGGLSGLTIAVNAFGGPVSRTGFAALAIVWMTSTALAWTAARRRAWTTHRAWMLRSFALTFAAVTLRLQLPLLQASGLSFEEAYRIVAWLCWVPNLLLVEWLVAREQQQRGPMLTTGSVRA
jgi:uncharacterized membrane protein